MAQAMLRKALYLRRPDWSPLVIMLLFFIHKLTKMADFFNIVVRVNPSGEEFDVELPRFSSGKEIINELLDAGISPRSDSNGNPYVYDLVHKQSNTHLDDNKTLHDLGIRDGDTLLLIPGLVAGQ